MKKKICIVSPSLKMGGIERALTVLADFFLSEGHQVYFISAQGGDKFYILDEKIIFFEPLQKREQGILGKINFYFNIIFFIRKTVNKVKPDLVLSFGDAFNPLVLLALWGIKIPIFISDRTSPDFKFNAIVNFGKKMLYPKSAGFIAQTQRAADYKVEQFGAKLNIRIIPNAIKEVVQYDIPKKKAILSVGRLSFEKGQDRLIEAFAQLKNRIGWELILAGNGPWQEGLKKLAKELNIEKEVVFLGKVDNVDWLLSEASIFVLPSRLEGFPNALCEAMSAGLPCVCFDSIPTEALITHNINGVVIEEANITGLAIVLQSLIDNPEKREYLGKNAILVKEILSAKENGNRFLDFILNK